MTSGDLPLLDAAALYELLPWAHAVDVIESALLWSGEGSTPPRSIIDVGGGQLLLMPAVGTHYAGVKIVTVAPANPASGLPRIQGMYLLLDAQTLAPVAQLDAAALTVLRTAAVSAVAIGALAEPDAARLVVFGTGPQAWGHVHAVTAVRPISHVSVIGRNRDRLTAFIRRCAAEELPVEPGAVHDIAAADIIVCATSSREPVFDSTLIAEHATVVAVGSHEPTAREVDTALVTRSTIIVESRESALREAGDLLVPIAESLLGPEMIAGDLGELVRGQVAIHADRPRLFKSVGEAGYDLVIAAAAYDRQA